MSTTERLLRLHQLGRYAGLSPEQLLQTHTELTAVLTSGTASLLTIELCDLYELQVLVLLMVGEDLTASKYLERLVDRFGSELQRVAVLRTQYLAATHLAAAGQAYARERFATSHDQHLVARAQVALSKRTDKAEDYMGQLVRYLETVPLDVQAWSELAAMYRARGHPDKAVFCLKEILLLQPHAYPTWHQAGEALLLRVRQLQDGNVEQLAEAALDGRTLFLRAVELCESHVPLWAGLYAITLDTAAWNVRLAKGKKAGEYLALNNQLHALAEKQLRRWRQDQELPAEYLGLIDEVLA